MSGNVLIFYIVILYFMGGFIFIFFLLWLVVWGGVRFFDVFKFVGVEYYLDFIIWKGKYVEFVSCDMCEVFSKFIMWDV